MINLCRYLASRHKLEQDWLDTEASRARGMSSEEADRFAAAESEWMVESLLATNSAALQA